MAVLMKLIPIALMVPNSLLAYQHQQQEHNHSSC
jgi:hypothetical protein